MANNNGIIINHAPDISIEEKARIFDLACEKYIEATDLKDEDRKLWHSPQEYMGYAIYKELTDMRAIVFYKEVQMSIEK